MPFDASTAEAAAMLSAETRRQNPLRQAVEMQRRLHKAVMDPTTPLREAAQAACAWDKLEGRKAVLRGLPANTSQSIRPETAKTKRTTASAVVLESEPETVKPSGEEPSEVSGV